MKRAIFSLAALLFAATTTDAQTLDAVRVGLDDNNGQVTYTIPQTSLQIEIQLSRETIRKGPYARFSQKYLGVIAPLTDKDIYTIKGATIGAAEVPTFKNAPATISVVDYVNSDTSFVRVAPDKMQVLDKSPEEMASSAAATIYMLRKRRIELITGDIGENVFGAGLQSALKEIDRLEQQYMALFLGKVTTTTYSQTIRITPDAAKSNYIVARFADNAGVVGEDNLSGRPLVLEMRADKRTIASTVPPKGAKSFATYRLPEVVSCRLLEGNREIASARVPMLQYGVDHQVAR